MLIFKNITLKNIGRFVEEQTVDILRLSNLNQVEGQNQNTGGSSGAGKSTLFNSIDYLLGLNNLSSTILQSRLTKDPISVVGNFELNGKPLTIARSKKGLEINYDGDVTKGSAKLAEEKLDQLIGIPRELFRKMLHKRQKEGGFFLDLTPKETYQFLTNSLGMSSLSEKAIKVRSDVQSLQLQLDNVNNSINTAKAVLESLISTESSLTEPEKLDFDQSKIDSLKQLILNERQKKQIALNEKAKKIEEIIAPKLSIPEIDRAELNKLSEEKSKIELELQNIKNLELNRISSIKSSISDILSKIHETDRQINDGKNAMNEAANIASEIKKIRASICPTCDQEWHTESAKTKELSLMSRLETLKNTIAISKDAENMKLDLQANMANLKDDLAKPVDDSRELSLRDRLSNIKTEIELEQHKQSLVSSTYTKKYNEEMAEYNKRVSEIESLYDSQIKLSDENISLLSSQAVDLEMKLRNYEAVLESYQKSKKNIDENKATYIANLKALQSKKIDLEDSIRIAEEASAVLKAYTSRRFDDALSYVSEESTRIIRSIPTMANATISMESMKETKDGKVKEEVTAIISSDGETEIPIKSLSGGERTAVDLAIDLAVINMLELKSNKGSNLFILDEPFNGLDTVGIEMALEVIRSSNLNKKIIIVDHNPIIGQMVDSKVSVVRNGEESRVIQ